MSRLKDRQRQIPGGFKFELPEINWKSQPFQSFDSIVNSVTTIVNANPDLVAQRGWPVNRPEIADWVDEFNAWWCDRNGWSSYTTGGASGDPPKFQPPPGLGQALAAGAKTIADWIGVGALPVAAELSAARAATCAACPLNTPGDLSSFFTRAASEIIRRQVQEANDLQLSTPDDGKLGVCEACFCPLRLKVHVPLDVILGRIHPDSLAALHEKCWIRSEQSLPVT
jgi:hypothetical protein